MFPLRVLDRNLGISGNSECRFWRWRAAISWHSWIMDDTLAPFALFELAQRVSSKPDTDLVYSDHDYIEETGSARFNLALQT